METQISYYKYKVTMKIKTVQTKCQLILAALFSLAKALRLTP